MANEPTITYSKALEAAFWHWRDFYEESERFDAVKDDHTQEWRDWQLRELQLMANCSCTVEWMLCDMFGMSEEQVHDDLMAILTKEGENASI